MAKRVEEVRVHFRLRDEAGASRAVAYLLLVAGPFICVTGILLVEHTTVGRIVAILLLAVVLCGVGACCRWRPERMPPLTWALAPFVGAAIITGLNIATRDASTGAQFFYLWPVLYAANFLGPRLNFLNVVLVSAGHAATVFTILGFNSGLLDWISVTVAMALTAFVVASLSDRNERLRAALAAQAFADPLTGVANRRSFDADLERAVGWARRTGEPISLLTLDIDHFKAINDTWGHAVGDRALQEVAAALRQVATRADDVVGRLGGDEFVLLVRTGPDGARELAGQLREVLVRDASLPGGPPGLSIGVAVLPDHAATAAELRAASDAALYQAKANGRGCTAVAGTLVSRHPVPRAS
jgi:diguanylate cyclase (GGDEF)-like protein